MLLEHDVVLSRSGQWVTSGTSGSDGIHRRHPGLLVVFLHSVFLLLIQRFQYTAVVSEAFRSLVPRRFFCTYVRSDSCSLQRLFTREMVEVRRGENKATPDLKLLPVFTPVRKAGGGRGLEERWRGGVAEEATVTLASAPARAFLPCEKALAPAVEWQERGLVRRSRRTRVCAAGRAASRR